MAVKASKTIITDFSPGPRERSSHAWQSALVWIATGTVLLNVACIPTSALDPSATTGGEPGSAALKGKVVEIGSTLSDVRDARLSISRVRKATANLYDEVTRQEVSFSYNPNLIGTTVIMTPAPSFSGVYLPARKKWVDLAMSEIGPIIHLFKEDVDAALESDRRTDVSDASRKLLNSLRDSAFSLVKEAFTDYKELQTLTAAEQFNNRAIAAASTALDRKMKELDRVLKRALSLLEKEARSAANQNAELSLAPPVGSVIDNVPDAMPDFFESWQIFAEAPNRATSLTSRVTGTKKTHARSLK